MRSITLYFVCGVLLLGSFTVASDAADPQATPEKWTVSYDTGSGKKKGKATFTEFWILPADGKYYFTTTINLTGYIEEGGSSQLQAEVVTDRRGNKVTLSWQWHDVANGWTSWVHTNDPVTLAPSDFQGVVVSQDGDPGPFAVTGHKG
jgi:hypothetical protein